MAFIQPTASYSLPPDGTHIRYYIRHTLDTNKLASSSDLGSAEREALLDNTYTRDKGRTTMHKGEIRTRDPS